MGEAKRRLVLGEPRGDAAHDPESVRRTRFCVEKLFALTEDLRLEGIGGGSIVNGLVTALVNVGVTEIGPTKLEDVLRKLIRQLPEVARTKAEREIALNHTAGRA